MAQFADNKIIETVCFTGHRTITRDDALYLPTKLKIQLKELILRGAVHFRAGGAMGFDTVAALCVLELKEEFPHIMLDLMLPCKDQTKLWNDTSVDVYNYILKNASSVDYVCDHYTNWCMMERNRRLVDGSQLCIAYLKQSSGGTAYTYSYALKHGVEVLNIAE